MEDHYDLIDDYLNGRLQGERRAAFEARLQGDPAFAEEVEGYRQARAAIRAAGRRELRAAVDEAYGQWEGRPRLQRWKRGLAIAAALLLLVAAPFVIRFFSPPSPQGLYADYFELPPAPALRTGDAADAWYDLVGAYHAGEYERVARELPALLQDTSFDRPAQGFFYLGVSQLMLDRPAAAAESFRLMPATSSLEQERTWYLALALLRSGAEEEAAAQLQEIAGAAEHYKKEEARRLLRRIGG